MNQKEIRIHALDYKYMNIYLRILKQWAFLKIIIRINVFMLHVIKAVSFLFDNKYKRFVLGKRSTAFVYKSRVLGK